MGRRIGFWVAMGILTLELSAAEFAQLQRLSDPERRARFDLPGSCSPTFTATQSMDARPSRLRVMVECRSPIVPAAQPSPEADGKQ